MIVTPLNPQKTIEWFERVDSQHEVLCIFLTAAPNHRMIITDLIQNYIDADIALGEKVGFIVSDSNFNTIQEISLNNGKLLFLPGEIIKPTPLNSIICRSEDRNATQKVPIKSWESQRLSDLTARSNIEWINLFSVARNQLPVLCVLIKGCDPIAIFLGDEISLTKLLKLLGEISDIANHDSSIELHAIRDLNEKITQYSILSDSLIALEKELIRRFDVLAKISKINDQGKTRIAEYIYSKNYKPKDLKELFESHEVLRSSSIRHPKTVAGIFNTSKEIEEIAEKINLTKSSEEDCESISAALDRITERRGKTSLLIEKLAHENYAISSVDRNSIAKRYDTYSVRVNTAVNIAEKVLSMFSKYRGANFLLKKVMKLASANHFAS